MDNNFDNLQFENDCKVISASNINSYKSMDLESKQILGLVFILCSSESIKVISVIKSLIESILAYE